MMSVTRKGCDAQSLVSEDDVKLCALCGTLNHKKNNECCTCGWRGAFDRDGHLVHLAWLRLYEEFEIVQMCHVASTKTFTVGEFGVPVKTGRMRSWSNRIRDWWAGVLSSHAQERSLRHGVRSQAYPHNELGV